MEWDPDSPEAREILRAPAPEDPVDPEMAAAGEDLYRRLGCAGCHSLGQGDFQGPDLVGVTVRRDYPWFRGMVMRPDSMIRWDRDAQILAERFRAPMPDQGASELQTRALWEYLRRVDGAGPSRGALETDGGEEP